MNSNNFVSVLDTHLLPFLRFCWKKYTFQLDNASTHTSSSTSQWFSANHIEVLKWPACSPDMNPMESLWGIRVLEIYANYKHFHSTGQLKAAILNVWSKIDAKTARNHLHSMNNRIFQFIQRNGNVIDYKRRATFHIIFIFLLGRYGSDTLLTHIFHIFEYFKLNTSDIIQVNCFYLWVIDIQFKKKYFQLKRFNFKITKLKFQM